jgi:hypothetical protein
VRHQGLPDKGSEAPRQRRAPAADTRRRFGRAQRDILVPSGPRPLPLRGPPARYSFPGDDWARSPITADFDPLYEDYDF